jgi:hypothetical protein
MCCSTRILVVMMFLVEKLGVLVMNTSQHSKGIKAILMSDQIRLSKRGIGNYS